MGAPLLRFASRTITVRRGARLLKGLMATEFNYIDDRRFRYYSVTEERSNQELKSYVLATVYRIFAEKKKKEKKTRTQVVITPLKASCVGI